MGDETLSKRSEHREDEGYCSRQMQKLNQAAGFLPHTTPHTLRGEEVSVNNPGQIEQP
jgi:hypothetical protein